MLQTSLPLRPYDPADPMVLILSVMGKDAIQMGDSQFRLLGF